MAVRFKNDAELQQFLSKHNGRVTGGPPLEPATGWREGAPIVAVNISPTLKKILGWIVIWFLGFMFGALTR